MLKNTTAAQKVVELAQARISKAIDTFYPGDYVDYDFYLRLKAAYSGCIVYVVDANTVRAVVADTDFKHIARVVLDVDAGENACIHEVDANSAEIKLRCYDLNH